MFLFRALFFPCPPDSQLEWLRKSSPFSKSHSSKNHCRHIAAVVEEVLKSWLLFLVLFFFSFFFKVHIKTVDSKICGLSRVMHHCFWKNVAVNCNIFKIISNNLSWLTQNYELPLVIRNLGQPTFKKKHQYMLTLHGHAWADTACLSTLNKLTGVCTMMRAYVCVHSRKHNEVCMTFAQCPKNTGWGDTFSAQGLMK